MCWIDVKTVGIWLRLTPDKLISWCLIYNYCLNIVNNKISSIPREIGNLTSLQALRLGEWIVLDWFENQWNVFALSTPDELICYSFTYTARFNLEINQISSIAPEIGNLTSLKKLNLGECVVLDWFGNRWNSMVSMHSMGTDALVVAHDSWQMDLILVHTYFYLFQFRSKSNFFNSTRDW